MPESKFFQPFVIQLRQYMPNPQNTGFTFYKDLPFSFDYASDYSQEVKLKTPIGFFIASLIAPNIESINSFVEMGNTLESRARIEYPGTTDDIVKELSARSGKPHELDVTATFHSVRGSGKPIQLRALFTDRVELIKNNTSIPARV